MLRQNFKLYEEFKEWITEKKDLLFKYLLIF